MRILPLVVLGVLFGWNAATRATEPSATAQLATTWKNYYDFDCDAAAKNAAALLKSTDLSDRLHGQHIQARALWTIGDPALKKQAQGIWTRISNANQRAPPATLRLATARLLVADDAAAAATQSAAALESLLEKPPVDVAAIEAWIELANYYAGLERKDAATSSLDAADKFITDSLGTSEEGDPLWGVFRRAIKDARNRIHDPGKLEFERAIGLMKAKRYEAAMQQFALVIERFPRTDYAPRSDLAMGDCWLSQSRPEKAEQVWSAFVTAMPAGPWRGHALVRLIDLHLEQFLDSEKAGNYAQMLDNSLPVALADAKSSQSWHEVIFDANYRLGIIFWAKGAPEQAATYLARAAEASKTKVGRAGLDRLIASAKANHSLMPPDVIGADGKATSGTSPIPSSERLQKPALALSVGVIHLATGELDKAERCFEKLLDRKANGYTEAAAVQKAFAEYGKGAVMQQRGKYPLARARYEASLRLFPAGTWHDETLYRLATTIQDHADQILNSTPDGKQPPADSPRGTNSVVAKAQSEALSYWQKLIENYATVDRGTGELSPTSPRVELAMYFSGVLSYAAADRVPLNQSDKTWQEVSGTLGRYLRTYPKSGLSGGLILRQTDIAMERLFDLGAASRSATHGVTWAQEPLTTSRSDVVVANAPWAAVTAWPEAIPKQEVLSHSLLRSGLVAYLEQNYGLAAEQFQAADAAGLPKPYVVVGGSLRSGMDVLVAAAKKGERLTPPEVQKGNPRVAMILGLGDLYFAAEQWDKARELYHRVYEQQVTPVSPDQAAWAAFMIARTHFWQREFLEASRFYHEVFERYPKSPWAATALFYNATMAYSNLRDVEEATGCLEQIRRSYPQHEMAERATYLTGQFHQWRREFPQAVASYKEYLEKYPKGLYANGIKESLLPEAESNRSGLD